MTTKNAGAGTERAGADLQRRLDEILSDPDRLAAVRRTALMDTPAEEAFDRLTRLASHILEAPLVLVSLIDDERHFFKSHVGLPEPYATTRERPMAQSFCQYTMAFGHPLVIEDAGQDPLVRDNPATLDFGIGGYMGMPLVTSDGHPIGNFCVIDSEPRQWTDEQLQAMDDLTASVMTEIEVRTLAREAEAAARIREEVLEVVSHDLRSPLHSVLMAAKLLEGEPGLPDEDRGRQIGVILRSAERMDRLVGDLLDVAKIESERFSVEREDVDPGRLVREAVELFRGDAAEKTIELEALADDALPTIRADGDRLLRVLENLLSNAIKFTPTGGRVAVGAEREEDDVRFFVRDTGPGIPEEDLPRLFDRFWQGRRERSEGTGLGLPIAKGIVEAHGGRIEVDTEEGRGSTFHLTVPRDDRSPA